jgi:carbon-monoxide dehydrogenase large subunit
MIAPAPALNNAVHDAIGVRIHSYPLSRERVYMASREAGNGKSDFWGYELDPGKTYSEVCEEWRKSVG